MLIGDRRRGRAITVGLVCQKKNQKTEKKIREPIFTCKSNTHLEKSVPGLLKAELHVAVTDPALILATIVTTSYQHSRYN